MTTYIYDVKCFFSIEVKANSRNSADDLLWEHINGTCANLGAWPEGNPILVEMYIDGDPDFIEAQP